MRLLLCCRGTDGASELAALDVFVLVTRGFRSAVFRWAPMQPVVHHKPLGELCITHTIARCTLQLAGYGVATVVGWHTGTFLLLCGECFLAVTAVAAAAAAAACAHSGEDAFRTFGCFSWVRMLAMLLVWHAVCVLLYTALSCVPCPP